MLLLFRRSDAFQHLHIASVGGRAVQGLRRQRAFAQFSGDIGVIEVRQPFARLGIRQKEVPQPRLTRLLLGPVEQFQLTGGIGPPIGAAFAKSKELLGDRIDILADVLGNSGQKRLGLLRHFEIVHVQGLIDHPVLPVMMV